jgi:hypothetical protein
MVDGDIDGGGDAMMIAMRMAVVVTRPTAATVACSMLDTSRQHDLNRQLRSMMATKQGDEGSACIISVR